MTTPKPRALVTTLDIALLRGVVEEIPLGVATMRGSEILYANAALERLWAAPAGSLDGQPLDVLFGADTLESMRLSLKRSRVFDGRVTTRGFDGRRVHAEVHLERYKSLSVGAGGFLLVRDVTLEFGALGRLIDDMGGVLFRLRTADGALEHVSSGCLSLIGLDAEACLVDPDALIERVSPEERERLDAVYRRVLRSEVAMATADFVARRADGVTVTLHARAIGITDSSGEVRHVECVLLPAKSSMLASPTTLAEPELLDQEARAAGHASAILELSRELLREANLLMGGAVNDIGSLQSLFETARLSLPGHMVERFEERLATASAAIDISHALCRRVRRAMDCRISRAAVIDLLENVRSGVSPLIGEHASVIDPGDAGGVFIKGQLDQLCLALVHLALRAFRLSGSQTLRLQARRISPDVRIEIVGEQAGHNDVTSCDTPSGPVSAVPGRRAVDSALEAALTLLTSVGGTLEADEITQRSARTTVRIRGLE